MITIIQAGDCRCLNRYYDVEEGMEIIDGTDQTLKVNLSFNQEDEHIQRKRGANELDELCLRSLNLGSGCNGECFESFSELGWHLWFQQA